MVTLPRKTSEKQNSASPSTLFTVSHDDDVLSFGDVVLNDVHVLRSILVTNTSDDPLCISLRCNLNDRGGENQACFQLENQNLQYQDASNQPTGNSYNQIFNMVGLIEQFALEPCTAKELIISLRPRKERYIEGDDEEPGDTAPIDKHFQPIDKHFHYYQVRGKVTLSAVVTNPDGQPVATQTNEEHLLRIEANACMSMLRADTHSIAFDDSIPGGEYWKEFTVWNLSEIPLSFSLDRCSAMRDSLFQFTVENEEESGHARIIGSGAAITVDGLSHVRVYVRFRPTKDCLGESNYTVEIENIYNSRNVEVLDVHTIVTKDRHLEGLQISVGTEIDFGDCYSEVGAERDITLRNVTEQILLVKFSMDRTHKAGGVTFRIKEIHDSDLDVGRVNSEEGMLDSVDSDNEEKNVDRDDEGPDERTEGRSKEKRQQKQSLEVLPLNPGATKIITCRYRPRRPDEPFSLMQEPGREPGLFKKPASRKLTRHTFRMWLRCHDDMDRAVDKYSKMLLCQARVCTSWVVLDTPEMDFGDANVGAQLTRIVQVSNLSELPARIAIRSKSKVLSFQPRVATIPAKQNYDIKVQFSPKFLNPNYQKSVTFVNLDNEDNEQILEVRANITDQHRVTFHSLFYFVQNRGLDEVVNFGDCVVDNKVVRTVKVINKSVEHGLSLVLKTESPEFGIYSEKTERLEGKHTRMSPESLSVQGDAGIVELDTLPSARGKKEQLLEEPLMNPLMQSDDRLPNRRAITQGRRTLDSGRRRRDSFDEGYSTQTTRAERASSASSVLSLPRSKTSTKRGSDFKMDNEQDLAVAYHNSHARSASPKAPRGGKLQIRAGSPEAAGMPQRSLANALAIVSSHTSQGQPMAEPGGKRTTELAALAALVGDTNTTSTAFANSEAEVAHVEAVIARRALAEQLTRDKHLVPSTFFNLPPGGEHTVYIIFEAKAAEIDTGDPRSLKLQNKTSKLLFHLEQFEPGIALSEGMEIPEVIPVREVPLRARYCVSKMSLQQRSINFGTMHAGEERIRVMIITNESEVPLLYNVEKTGSIDSQNMQIGSTFGSSSKGVVRPFSTKQVAFLFKPTLHNSSFFQTLTVKNVRDPSKQLQVNVKASVHKPVSFQIHTSELDFGPTLLNERSRTLRLVLTNTTNKMRMFTLEAVLENLGKNKFRTDMYFQLDMLERAEIDEKTVENTEEKIDVLEQSMKKMLRKGKKDKVKKAQAELARLREKIDPGQSSDSDTEDDAFNSLSDSEDEDGEDDREKMTRQGRRAKIQNDARPRRNGITFNLKPHTMQVIFVTFVARPDVQLESANSMTAEQRKEAARPKLVSGLVRACETQNVDFLKEIELTATVCPGNDAYLQVVGEVPPQLTLERRKRQLVSLSNSSPSVPVLLRTSGPGTRASAPKLPSAFQISPDRLNIGKVIVLLEAAGKFSITNSSPQSQSFIVMVSEETFKGSSKTKQAKKEQGKKHATKALFRITPNGGAIPPFGSVSITVHYTARSSGKHGHQLIVRNIRGEGVEDLPVYVAANASHPIYLRCLDTDSEGKLNFGKCYIDPVETYVKVAPIRLMNVHDAKVAVMVTSNLTRQVTVFNDAELSSPAVKPVLVDSGATATHYIALSPHKKQADERGQSHEMVGGIRVEVQSADAGKLVELTYKFTAVMTMSSVRLSTHSIDLGAAQKLGDEFTGTFSIENLTEHMPVDFEIVKPKWIRITPLHGRLEGRVSDSEKSERKIKYVASADAYGYLSERIVLVNKMRPSQQLAVAIRLFVDDLSLQVDLPQENGISILELEPVYVFAPPMMPRDIENKDNEKATVFDWARASVEVLQTRFSVTNNLDADIDDLVPLSDMEITLCPGEVSPTGAPQAMPLVVPTSATSTAIHSDPLQMLPACGKTFSLDSGQLMEMCFSLNGIASCPGISLPKLRKGIAIPVNGKLMLRRKFAAVESAVCYCPVPWHHDHCRMLESRVAKTIHFRTSTGMSLGKLVKNNVDLGNVGVVSSWQPVPFTFSIQNLCEVPLVYSMLAVPSCFHLDNESGMVGGSSCLDCSGTLKPVDLKHLVSSSHSWQAEIVISNDHNPHNVMKLIIKANVMTRLLTYTRVVDDSISLPALSIPSSGPAVAEWFAIENISGMPLELQLITNLKDDVGSVIVFDVKSRESNVKLSAFKLEPSEEVEVRLLARPKLGARVLPLSCITAGTKLPPPTSEQIPTGQDGNKAAAELDFGTLDIKIGSEVADLHEAIHLKGFLEQGQTFSLSKARLNLRTDDDESEPAQVPSVLGQTAARSNTETILGDQFEIKNLSSIYPLDFRVFAVEKFDREENVISLVPSEGSVPANCSVMVSVKVDPRLIEDPDEISSMVNIFVTDCNVKMCTTALTVNFTGWASQDISEPAFARNNNEGTLSGNTTLETSPLKDRSVNAVQQSDAGASTLVLRGCTPVAYSVHRYEIDLGQQTLSSDKVVQWELTLSNPSPEEKEYRIFPVANVENWLILNHTRGIVNPVSSSNITLSLSAARMGRYSTYLLLENCANPADLKTIKVRMEVVAKSSKWSQEHFSVVIDGKSDWIDTPVINLGDCFHGRLYRHRSFVLCNHSGQTLDFQVKSNLEDADERELDFSQTNNSLKKFRTITVGAHSSIRVFIFFRVSSRGSVGPNEMAIFISCRLIKNYQLTIRLRAKFCRPQLAVANRKQIDFVGMARPMASDAFTMVGMSTPPRQKSQLDRKDDVQGPDVYFDHSEHDMIVTNVSEEAVDVVIRNDTMFFSISARIEDSLYAPRESRSSDSLADAAKRDISDSKRDQAVEMIGASHGVISSNRYKKQVRATLQPGAKFVITVRPNNESIVLMYGQIMKEKHVDEHVTIYNNNVRSQSVCVCSNGLLTKFHWSRIQKNTDGHSCDYLFARNTRWWTTLIFLRRKADQNRIRSRYWRKLWYSI
jgi:hypothetical protein